MGLAESTILQPADPLYWLSRATAVGSSLHLHAPLANDATFAVAGGNPAVFLYSFDYVRLQASPGFLSAKLHLHPTGKEMETWMIGGWWRSVRAFGGLEMALLAGAPDRLPLALDDRDRAVVGDLARALAAFATTGNASTPGTCGYQLALCVFFLGMHLLPLLWKAPTIVWWNGRCVDFAELAWPTVGPAFPLPLLSLDFPSKAKVGFHSRDVLFWNEFAPQVRSPQPRSTQSNPCTRFEGRESDRGGAGAPPGLLPSPAPRRVHQ